MKLLEQNVRPFDGLDEIKLLSSLNDIKEYLKRGVILKFLGQFYMSKIPFL